MAINGQQPDNAIECPRDILNRVALHLLTVPNSWVRPVTATPYPSGQARPHAIGHVSHDDGLPVGMGLQSKRVYGIKRCDIPTANYKGH